MKFLWILAEVDMPAVGPHVLEGITADSRLAEANLLDELVVLNATQQLHEVHLGALLENQAAQAGELGPHNGTGQIC